MGASIARPPVKRPPEFKFRGQNGIVITKDRMIAASRQLSSTQLANS
jgi:hypothetical protein